MFSTFSLVTFKYLTKGSLVGEWLGRSLAVLGVDGSSLLTASHILLRHISIYQGGGGLE